MTQAVTQEALTLALNLAAPAEGLHDVRTDGQVHSYYCPAHVLTWGYGHTGKDVTPDRVGSKAEAVGVLQMDMTQAMAAAFRLCPALIHATAGQIAAVADFVFNLGAGAFAASTLRRMILKGDWDRARIELAKWVHGGGRRLPGLVLRRQAEILLTKG